MFCNINFVLIGFTGNNNNNLTLACMFHSFTVCWLQQHQRHFHFHFIFIPQLRRTKIRGMCILWYK